VDYETVEPLAAAITPVPGGVGPMTVTMLLVNTVASWRATFAPAAAGDGAGAPAEDPLADLLP